MRPRLYIVGAGPGSPGFLSEKAKEVLRSVDRVFATTRIAGLHADAVSLPLSQLTEELGRPHDGTTAVLVGGDSGFFSAAKAILRDFSKLYDIELLPGIGSISCLSARIGESFEDACLISVHGRENRIVPCVAYHEKTYALTGGSVKPQNICSDLYEAGLSEVEVVIGEKLSYPDERIVRGKPMELMSMTFDDLSVVYVGNPNAVNPYVPLRDGDFMRPDESMATVPMTKEEIRWVALAKLRLTPTDIVYDIGTGTGSVGVEAARKAFSGFVYAFERKAEACEWAEKNRRRHGTFNVTIVHGTAPERFDGLPPPDKAFIGGSGGNIEAIVRSLVAANPEVRIVATAVSPKSLYHIIETLEKVTNFETDTICVNVAKSRKAGRYDIMAAQNPVYIVTGEAPCES